MFRTKDEICFKMFLILKTINCDGKYYFRHEKYVHEHGLISDLTCWAVPYVINDILVFRVILVNQDSVFDFLFFVLKWQNLLKHKATC